MTGSTRTPSWRHRARAFGGRIGVRLYRMVGGRGMGADAELPVVLLTIRGRRTGRSRTVCVASAPVPEGHVVWGTGSGSPHDPEWFQNLRAATTVDVQLGQAHWRARPRELVGEERDRVWREVVLARRPQVERYARKAGRGIPVAVLEALSTPTAPVGVTGRGGSPVGRPATGLVGGLLPRLMRAGNAATVGLYRRSGGRIGGRVKGVPVLVLTVPGRRSGVPRSACVTYFRDGSDYVVCGSAGGAPREPDWFRNLRSAATAQVQTGRTVAEVAVRVLSGTERDAVFREVVLAGAPFFADYERKGGRTLPVARLTPLD